MPESQPDLLSFLIDRIAAHQRAKWDVSKTIAAAAYQRALDGVLPRFRSVRGPWNLFVEDTLRRETMGLWSDWTTRLLHVVDRIGFDRFARDRQYHPRTAASPARALRLTECYSKTLYWVDRTQSAGGDLADRSHDAAAATVRHL